jgi:hypothetical protein
MVEFRLNRNVFYGLMAVLGIGLALGAGLLIAQLMGGKSDSNSPVAQATAAPGQLTQPDAGAIQIDPSNPQAAVDAITGQSSDPNAALQQPTPSIDYAKFGIGADGELTPQQDGQVARIEIADAVGKLGNPGVLFVDTRSSIEFEQGHIQGAQNVQAYAEDNKLETLPKDKEIILYCA